MNKHHIVLLFSIICLIPHPTIAATFPETCQTACKTPYGKILGRTPSNIAAYSNCKSSCVVFSPHHINNTFTGIKWQCVEFARRWLYISKGVVYESIDIAADIWNLDHVNVVKDNSQKLFKSITNGADALPQKGDLLIYSKDYLKTGHIAVVLSIDSQTKIIKVAEQNYLNQIWSADFARAIPYIKHQNQFWLLDQYLLGWKHVDK